MLRLSGLLIAVILYGSLFPFDFRAAGGPLVAIRHLFLHAWTPESLSFPNVVSNVLLYMPLGFALACGAVAHIGRVAALVVAIVLGAFLSTGVELAQHYLPSRVTDLPDILTNTTGAFLGGAFGALCGDRGQVWSGRARVADPIAFLLAGAWMADCLWPFVPTLDIGNIKNGLKQLLLRPELVLLEVLRYGACSLAFATLLQAAIPGRLSRKFVLTATLSGPLVGLAIEGRTITASSVLGALAGVVTWRALRRSSAAVNARWAAIFLMIVIASVGLAPFAYTQAPQPFDWIPFHEYIDSSILGASHAFLAKAFLYGSAVWASSRAGLGLMVGGAMVSVLLVAIGCAQMYLPGQSPGITDALIALCAMLAIQSFRTPVRIVRETSISSRERASDLGASDPRAGI
jgi:VanZ family protein